MLLKTHIDDFGRIVIPKELREQLNLREGTEVEVRVEGNVLVLDRVDEEPRLKKIDGFLVFTGDSKGDLSEAVKRSREDRKGQVMGEFDS
jgi:AbrB family looped-hinge helix DNA binding protein